MAEKLLIKILPFIITMYDSLAEKSTERLEDWGNKFCISFQLRHMLNNPFPLGWLISIECGASMESLRWLSINVILGNENSKPPASCLASTAFQLTYANDQKAN